jgi:hypothetical protein
VPAHIIYRVVHALYPHGLSSRYVPRIGRLHNVSSMHSNTLCGFFPPDAFACC